jgi:hypothetical protein
VGAHWKRVASCFSWTDQFGEMSGRATLTNAYSASSATRGSIIWYIHMRTRVFRGRKVGAFNLTAETPDMYTEWRVNSSMLLRSEVENSSVWAISASYLIGIYRIYKSDILFTSPRRRHRRGDCDT